LFEAAEEAAEEVTEEWCLVRMEGLLLPVKRFASSSAASSGKDEFKMSCAVLVCVSKGSSGTEASDVLREGEALVFDP
jgi:hypothetical protein